MRSFVRARAHSDIHVINLPFVLLILPLRNDHANNHLAVSKSSCPTFNGLDSFFHPLVRYFLENGAAINRALCRGCLLSGNALSWGKALLSPELLLGFDLRTVQADSDHCFYSSVHFRAEIHTLQRSCCDCQRLFSFLFNELAPCIIQ